MAYDVVDESVLRRFHADIDVTPHCRTIFTPTGATVLSHASTEERMTNAMLLYTAF